MATQFIQKFYLFLSLLIVGLCLGKIPYALATAQEKPLPVLPPLSERIDNKLIVSGWYTWDPYQYESSKNEDTQKTVFLTGLDIKLMQAILDYANFQIHHSYVNWGQHQMDLKDGKRDLAAGAFYSNDRAQYAYYSEPYREETNVLYLKKGQAKNYPFRDTKGMLEMFKARKFRLGIIGSYKYAAPIINDFINDPANQDLLVKVKTETENFEHLFKDKIDGFLVDRLVGATLMWRNHWQSKIDIHPNLLVSDKIYAIFSKKTTTPETVQQFNQALKKIKKSGHYKRIVMDYTFPILLAITVEKVWFLTVDLIGTIAFAISGLLLAHREKYSLIGAFVLASLPAMGGGAIRDLTLNRHPIGLLRSTTYILAVLCTLLVVYAIIHTFRHLSKYLPWLQQLDKRWDFAKLSGYGVHIFDSLGLSAFTIIGVIITVNANIHPLMLWGPIFAVATSIGGGVMRDVLRGERNIPFLKGELYAELSAVWGIVFCAFLNWQIEHLNPNAIFIGVIVTLLGCFISRLLVMYIKVASTTF